MTYSFILTISLERLNHLRGIPGLNSSLVGGDISLAFVHYPSFGECDDSTVLEKIEELEKLKAEEVNKTHTTQNSFFIESSCLIYFSFYFTVIHF